MVALRSINFWLQIHGHDNRVFGANIAATHAGHALPAKTTVLLKADLARRCLTLFDLVGCQLGAAFAGKIVTP